VFTLRHRIALIGRRRLLIDTGVPTITNAGACKLGARMQHRHIHRVEERHNVSPCTHIAPSQPADGELMLHHRLRGAGDALLRERSLSSVTSALTQLREAYAGDEVQG
jgi:hypothetical protein